MKEKDRDKLRAKKIENIYAYPITALEKFYQLGHKTPCEYVEDVETLRLLELGFEIKMVDLQGSGVAVDNPEDLERVIQIIKEQGRD